MAGNPQWQAGMKSPNPDGRTPHRERLKKVTTKQEQLQKKIATYLAKKWGRMITDLDMLSAKDRSRAYLELMQFAVSKKGAEKPEAISQEDIDRLYDLITSGATMPDINSMSNDTKLGLLRAKKYG